MKTNQPNPTYSERAVALQNESAIAEISTINQAYRDFLKSTQSIEKSTIDSANKAREIGIHLQTLCGHEQISLSFWNSRCVNQTAFDFETAKIFIATAKKMPKPAQSLKEAVPFIQTMLVAGDLLQMPERAGSQSLSPLNPVQRFFNEFTLMRQPWQKITRTKPIEQWESGELEQFISETEWLSDEREKAKQLLTK